MTYQKFGKIPSLRNLLKDPVIKNLAPNHTKLKFYGAVKLHGTHAAIKVGNDGTLTTYSRNRELTLQSDNNGFAAWVNSHKLYFLDNWKENVYNVWLYGEWIGPGIQKGVAINNLPEKQFVLFGVFHEYPENPDLNYYVDAFEIPPTWSANDIGMYSIKSAGITWIVEIDVNNPNGNGAIDNINNWVEEVEKQCPWASQFDIEGVGEGIVFTCWDLGRSKPPIRFKAKGEKHQATNEKKAKAAINPIVQSLSESFIEAVLTERRLEQGLEYLQEMDLDDSMENLGIYIKWIHKDIVTEEKTLLGELSLEWNDVKKPLTSKIVKWYKMPR